MSNGKISLFSVLMILALISFSSSTVALCKSSLKANSDNLKIYQDFEDDDEDDDDGDDEEDDDDDEEIDIE